MYFLLTEHGFSASGTHFQKKKSHFSSIKKAIFLLAIFWVFWTQKMAKLKKKRCMSKSPQPFSSSYFCRAVFTLPLSPRPLPWNILHIRGQLTFNRVLQSYSLLKFFCNFLFLLSPKFIQFVEQPLS